MEALNEQQYPLVKLVLEQALEPELVRVQALRVQALVWVQLEPLVQALVWVQLEPLVQALVRVQLKLKRHLQQNRSKPQLYRHHCKEPDRSQEPQRELRQTRAHPKALDMTPLALVQRELQVLGRAQVPEREQLQERAAQLAQELVRRAQQEPLKLQARVQELEPAPELHVFLARLPLQRGSTQHI